MSDTFNAFGDAADDSSSSSNPQGWKPPGYQAFGADLVRSHPHYAVTGFIQQGGMGAVYRAKDLRDDKGIVKDIAIKVLNPDLLSDPRELERFQREITILRGLDHPHIIPLLDSGDTPRGHHFFVMPFLGSRTLADAISPRLTPKRVLQLMQQVSEAVHYAHTHEKKIIHRDLKPSNILLADPDESPRVLDFGVARTVLSIDELGTLTRTQDTPGTYGYMAPERRLGQPADQRSDVFSLGVIFYQLLTGHIPEAGPTPLADFGLDPRLDVIFTKAHRQDPRERYQTALEFAEALKAAVKPIASSSSQEPSTTDDEYPTPDPASIVIEFNETSLVVNGLDFSLDTTIEDWMQVLGRYSETDILDPVVTFYFWHHLGLSLRTYRGDTETLFVTPSNSPASNHEFKDTLFKPGNGSYFTPFSGMLRMNGVTLARGFDFQFLQKHDRRFANSRLNESNEYEYNLSNWGGRYSFLESSRSGTLSAEDKLKPRLWSGMQQSAHLHYGDVMLSELSKALFWVGGAYCGGDITQNQNKEVALFSITRLHVNQEYKWRCNLNHNGSFASIEDKLHFQERPLLKIVGHEYPALWRNDREVEAPQLLILTNRRVIVILKSGRDVSFDIKSKIRSRYLRLQKAYDTHEFVRRVLGSLFLIGPMIAFIILADQGHLRGFDELNLFLKICGYSGGLILLGLAAVGVTILGEAFRSNLWLIDIECADQQRSFRFSASRYGCSSIVYESGFGDAGSITFTHPEFQRLFSRGTGLPGEFEHFSLFLHWLNRLNQEPLLKFPLYSTCRGHSFDAHPKDRPLHPCPTCGKEVAKSARECPHCGENLLAAQEPKGWRQKRCTSCQSVMSRFAEKCQGCGHPNTWLKVQSLAATAAVLVGGIWCWQHFQAQQLQGIALPALFTAAALGWRVGLSMLRSFYSH